MGILTRVGTALGIVKHTEGQFRDGPYVLPVSGGWLPAGSAWNFWQLGQDVRPFGTTAMVEACVSAYAQTVAMCPGGHWRTNDKGGRERVTMSALNRILRGPNAYQSISDFLLNLTRSLYLDGNAYAVAIRNDRFEITELHLMDPRTSGGFNAGGEVFYKLSGNELIESRIGRIEAAPARDVLHIRLHTPWHPLHGATPLEAAALQMAAGNAALQQQVAFFINQARPSYILATDEKPTREQSQQLRDLWDQQSKGLNAGGTPILTFGLKPYPLSVSAKDTQLVDILKLNDQAIANVFRVPLQILGIGGGSGVQPGGSTETLMAGWLAGALGFALNHIEEGFGRLFSLKGQPDEYLEFDTSALLRSAFKDRVEAFARSVQGGIHAPNEARREFELAEVEFGDEPRVQQQVVPLSAAGAIPAAPPAPGAP